MLIDRGGVGMGKVVSIGDTSSLVFSWEGLILTAD